MALELPFGVKPVNPLPVDYWSGPYSGVSIQEAIDSANSGIPSPVRFISMEVRLIVNDEAKKYWYESGIADNDLVPLSASGEVTTEQLEYISGIAIQNYYDIQNVSGIAYFASGNTINNFNYINYVSGIAAYASGIATFASGSAVDNFDYINYVSGIAAYASGSTIDNFNNINYVSGITTDVSGIATYASEVAAYASGHTLQTVTDNGSITDNQITVNNDLTVSGMLSVGVSGIEFSDGTRQFTAYSDNGTFFTGPAYAIWTGAGLVFDVIYPIYYIDGSQYPAGTDQVTLSNGDGTYDRFDAIVVDSGGVNVVEGIPEANPVFPQPDSLNELLITYIEVPNNATTPGGITEELVYNENVEWTTATNNGTVDFEDTVNPFVGTKHISCHSYNSSNYIQFTDSVTHSITDYSILRLYLKLDGTFSRNTYLRFRFYNGSNPVSDYVDLIDGNFNYDRTNSSAYQVIAIPISAFTFLSSSFDRIYIGFNGTNTTHFYIDYIGLQNGIPTASPQPDFFKYIIVDNGIVTADAPNDSLKIINSEKTGDKEITITASGAGARTYNNITTDFSMIGTSDVVFLDTTSNLINVYLPDAVGKGGKELLFKMTGGTNPGVLIASGAQTVDGQGSVSMLYAYESLSLISDNANWYIT